jgi:hypothetical protein
VLCSVESIVIGHSTGAAGFPEPEQPFVPYSVHSAAFGRPLAGSDSKSSHKGSPAQLPELVPVLDDALLEAVVPELLPAVVPLPDAWVPDVVAAVDDPDGVDELLVSVVPGGDVDAHAGATQRATEPRARRRRCMRASI